MENLQHKTAGANKEQHNADQFCGAGLFFITSEMPLITNTYKKKHTPKKQHLLNSKYELLTTREQFYGDISTLFQSHC